MTKTTKIKHMDQASDELSHVDMPDIKKSKPRGRPAKILSFNTVTWPVADFTAAGNSNLKSNRVKEIDTYTLAVWIKRYVFDDCDIKDDFKIYESGNNVVVEFSSISYAARCETLFEQIKSHGFPQRGFWVPI